VIHERRSKGARRAGREAFKHKLSAGCQRRKSIVGLCSTSAAGTRAASGTGTGTGTEGDNPMADNQPVTDLVTRAKNGEMQAWDALVERYAPLIWSICRRFRLDGADAEDVGQAVWLKLIIHLNHLRDSAALPGWLATTTRRECSRVFRAAGARRAGEQVLNAENLPDTDTAGAEQELLAAERHAALRDAFTRLAPGCQQLLALVTADPPVPYAEISARLGISVGSIGPNRRRCLDRLARDPVIAALINAEAASAAC
jgi:RNA polymerase sigma factor (sigma-70 family)